MVYIHREYDYQEIADMAEILCDLSMTYPIITFKGPLGAGKTTLIRSFLGKLGVTENITSPSFTYVSCYLTKNMRRVYHFDLYRIKSVACFEQMGFNEYLYEPDALILIEWPDILAKSLMQVACAVILNYTEVSQKRVIVIQDWKDSHDI